MVTLCGVFLAQGVGPDMRQVDSDCLDGLKRMWDCEDVEQAWLALHAWIQRWGDEPGCDKLVSWVEANIEETFSVYRLPCTHRRLLKSNNMLERTNEEIRRRLWVIRILPMRRRVCD